MRVGTQGLFHPCLKTFVAPFLPARLTAPGPPPRMEEGTWSGKENGSLPECTGDMAVRMRKGTGHTEEHSRSQSFDPFGQRRGSRALAGSNLESANR